MEFFLAVPNHACCNPCGAYIYVLLYMSQRRTLEQHAITTRAGGGWGGQYAACPKLPYRQIR
eukprot:scaffold642364_cov36-Prasinocladus_malaysianus.AAC.1